MGILNVTPDSFFDGGNYCSIDTALYRVEQMLAEGASLIDIGGESTRPDAQVISLEEELQRVIPVIEAIAARFDTWLSIDTYKPEVMAQAAVSGVHLINDIMALQIPGALEVAAASNLPICLMHRRSQPGMMERRAHYHQLLFEMIAFFQERMTACQAAGIAKARLLLDPGFGFDKTVEHNYQILGNLKQLHTLSCPLLIGLSRKSMIRYALADLKDPGASGSVAAAVIAVMQGVRIVRVHDVRETVEALRIASRVLDGNFGSLIHD